MRFIQDNNRERGAISILIAVALVVLLGAAAFAIDMGYAVVVKSELQNAADTGSLAGTRELALVYQSSPNFSQHWGSRQLTSGEINQIANKVNEYTKKNKAGGVAINVPIADITFGKYNKDTGEIEKTSPEYTGVMAIKVKTRRDTTSNGVVNMGLARVIGNNSVSLNAESGSTLSILKKAPPGKLGIPIALSEHWFKSKDSPCGDKNSANHGIRLYPQNQAMSATGGSCAGFHTYQDYPANAAKLKNILAQQATDAYVSPPTEAGVTIYNFVGGELASVWSNLEALYDAEKDNNKTWTTVVPIYKGTDCSNPGGPIMIVGFATVYVYKVKSMPGAYIDAKVVCNVVDWGEGGNDTDYGTIVGRPGMTE